MSYKVLLDLTSASLPLKIFIYKSWFLSQFDLLHNKLQTQWLNT